MGNLYSSLVVTVAKAEVGYLEKKSNSLLDNKTANAGSANYTKYGRDMHAVYPQIMDFPAAWCDCFVDWCFYKAYGVANAKGLLSGNFDDYTVASAQLYKNKGAYIKRGTGAPKVGDQIFFNNGKRIYHTGLVIKVTSTTVYTIEGNTSSVAGVVANGGCVREKSYPLNYAKIDGYGRPKYDAEPVATEQTTTAVTKIDAAKSFSKSISGTYKVTATSLHLRAGAGTGKKSLLLMPNGAVVKCFGYYTSVSGTKWYYVSYNDTVGFTSSKYLAKQ